MALPSQRAFWKAVQQFSTPIIRSHSPVLLSTNSTIYRKLCSCQCVGFAKALYPQQTRYFSDQNIPSSSSSNEFSGTIPIDKLKISYTRSSGPGGQHVNTTNSKVEVRFSVKEADWIPEEAKVKIFEKEEARITKKGELVVTSDKTRKQLLNQAECLDKIRNIVFSATRPPPQVAPEKVERRRALQAKANRERLKTKSHRSMIKRARQASI